MSNDDRVSSSGGNPIGWLIAVGILLAVVCVGKALINYLVRCVCGCGESEGGERERRPPPREPQYCASGSLEWLTQSVLAGLFCAALGAIALILVARYTPIWRPYTTDVLTIEVGTCKRTCSFYTLGFGDPPVARSAFERSWAAAFPGSEMTVDAINTRLASEGGEAVDDCAADPSPCCTLYHDFHVTYLDWGSYSPLVTFIYVFVGAVAGLVALGLALDAVRDLHKKHTGRDELLCNGRDRCGLWAAGVVTSGVGTLGCCAFLTAVGLLITTHVASSSDQPWTVPWIAQPEQAWMHWAMFGAGLGLAALACVVSLLVSRSSNPPPTTSTVEMSAMPRRTRVEPSMAVARGYPSTSVVPTGVPVVHVNAHAGI